MIHNNMKSHSNILSINNTNKSHRNILVIYGGASPEEGPMGDTVYAELPSIHDIGKETVK